MRLVKHVARMEEKRNAHSGSVPKLKNRLLGRSSRRWRIIRGVDFKEKRDGSVYTCIIWLSIGTRGENFWTR